MKPSNIAFTLAMTMSTAVFADSSPVATTGFVSLFPSQTLQLHVLNLDDKECSLDYNLLDLGNNKLLTTSDKLTIKANSAESSDIFPLVTNITAPTIIRAELDFNEQLLSQLTLAGCGKLIPTLEIKTADSVAILITDFYGMPSGDKSESYKVKLCHKPGTSAQKTLEVAASAFKGHQSHGDKEGSCENLSDDHNHDDKGKNKD